MQTQPSVPPEPIQKPGVTISQKRPRSHFPLYICPTPGMMRERTAEMPGSRRVLLTEQNNAAADDAAQVTQLHADLLRWYASARRDLPWRRTRDPWAIWVSEIMLQQTRVETVRPYYERFLIRFPTPSALAEAAEDDVLAAWSGLGYYRRARMLHAGARHVAGATMPDRRDALLALPGIGRYTAGAIASIAYGEAVGLVDGNVARVLARIFAIPDDMRRVGMKVAERLAERIVAKEDPGAWNQALMELGATICTPRSPGCSTCPVNKDCRAYAEGRVNQLPVLSEKTKPIPQRLQAIVAVNGDRILLARRRPDGLFGGLWEPPLVEGGPKVVAELCTQLGVRSPVNKGKVVHVLSHRRLSIDVHLAHAPKAVVPSSLPEAYESARFLARAELESVGIATLGRKILATAGVLAS